LNFPTAYRSVAVGLQLHKFNSCLEVYGLIAELWSLGAIDDVIQFITSGSIGGLPPIVVMIIPFILGLVVGFFVKKFLKIAIIAAIILVVVSYFGFLGLSLGALKDLSDIYGPVAVQYGVLLMGMLPLGLGLTVGLIIGFIFA
jgi:uncharacterized membrane protein (Fun14 family)